MQPGNAHTETIASTVPAIDGKRVRRPGPKVLFFRPPRSSEAKPPRPPAAIARRGTVKTRIIFVLWRRSRLERNGFAEPSRNASAKDAIVPSSAKNHSKDFGPTAALEAGTLSRLRGGFPLEEPPPEFFRIGPRHRAVHQ